MDGNSRIIYTRMPYSNAHYAFTLINTIQTYAQCAHCELLDCVCFVAGTDLLWLFFCSLSCNRFIMIISMYLLFHVLPQFVSSFHSERSLSISWKRKILLFICLFGFSLEKWLNFFSFFLPIFCPILLRNRKWVVVNTLVDLFFPSIWLRLNSAW